MRTQSIRRGLAAIADGVSASLFAAPLGRRAGPGRGRSAASIDDPAAVEAWLAVCREQWSRPINPTPSPGISG